MGQRLEHLDALRGVAALAVLVQHVGERLLAALPDGGEGSLAHALLLGGFNPGRFGIALFFLVSGYVIPFGFKGAAPLRGFLVGRLFRLYPAYWLSLAAALAMVAVRDIPLPPSTTILANVAMVQRFVGEPDVLLVYWTLAIEVIFYALCAALFAARRLGDARVLACAAIGLAGAALALALGTALSGRHLPANVATNLSLMFAGALLRRAWLDGAPDGRRRVPAALGAIVATVPAVQALSYGTGVPSGFDIPPLAFTAAYLSAIALFVACVARPLHLGRAAAWLGALSYAIYLFHAVVMLAARGLLAPGVPHGGWLYAAIVPAATIALAVLVHHGVERPMIRTGRRLLRPRPAVLAIA